MDTLKNEWMAARVRVERLEAELLEARDERKRLAAMLRRRDLQRLG